MLGNDSSRAVPELEEDPRSPTRRESESRREASLWHLRCPRLHLAIDETNCKATPESQTFGSDRDIGQASVKLELF